MNLLNKKPGYFLLKTPSWVFNILLLFTVSFTWAQNNISGTVVNQHGKPLANVEVFDSLGKSTITDTDGRFSISSEKETITLYFYKDYFLVEEQQFSTNQKEIFVILQDIVALNEVVIQRNKDRVFALKHLKDIEETAIYAGKKTETVLVNKLVANKSVNTARQIYAQVSGITFSENSDGGLQLNIGGRGLNPNRTSNFNTRQNGYDISADVLGYPESYYTPPTEALKEIQVVKGAASLQYGTQFGGLVNFQFQDPSKKSIELISRNTLGSYNLFTNFTSLSGTKGKFSYYTFFNYKQGDGFRPNSNFNSRNFFVNLNYQFNEKTSLHFDYTLFDYLAKQPGGLTDFMFNEDMFQSNRERNWFDVNWNLLALRLKHKFTDKANFSLQLFGLDASRSTVGYLSNRVSNADTPGTVRDLILGDFVNWGAEARFLQEYKINNQKSAFLIGGKYYQARNTAIQGPGSSGGDANFNLATSEFPDYASQSDYVYPNQNFSLFGENIFRISSEFTVTPGFRFENIRTKADGYYRNINTDLAGNVILDELVEEDIVKERNFLLLGVGLSYKPFNRTEFYGNISQNYRSVTFSDIRTVSPSQVIDPNITDEKGFTSDIGVRGKINNVLSYDTSIYALLYDDKIGEYQTSNPNGSAAVVSYRSNLGTALTYGWEALVDWDISNTFFNQNQNISWNAFINNAITNGEYIKSDVTGIEGNKVEFVPLFNIKTGTTLGYKNFKVSTQLTYVSSQYTDSNNTPTNTSDNTYGIFGEIPSYYVADLSASYTYKNFKIEAGINNFTNNYYFTKRATGYPGPGILPSEPRTFYTTLQIQL
ncbi:Fe(3+) dicitrate transport protein [Mesonia phycicola]|uniref:Fe(3+) dicitrate transport protein n=1 Tax=Mesonia phycicola TaxID=579105 RepID=A0A1M6FXD2_9FLAO|nr:TonB-dependent receptor [Mesonia phycicola]SHJ02363.1 Fe(3+) dicitrate transport protein [Mesonia phycicola]